MKFPELKADLDAGEGDIKFTPDFQELSWIMRADLLQDWIEVLSAAYRQVLTEPQQIIVSE